MTIEPHNSQWVVQTISKFDVSVSVVMTYGLIFDGLLRGEKLRTAFRDLVKRWPILGSRIGHDEKGNLAFLLPKSTDDFEHFTFEENDYKTPLSSHFHLPQATPTISSHPCNPDNIFKPPLRLRRSYIVDYSQTTPLQPIIHLQISRYSDNKTSVGMTAPHSLGDAAAMKEIFLAWVSVLKDGERAKLKSLDDMMIMDKIAGDAKLDRIPKGWYKKPEGDFLPVPEVPMPSKKELTESEEEEKGDMRWLFIPNSVMAKLKEECNTALLASSQWVSEGDILLAWCAKATYPMRPGGPPPPTRPLGLLFPMDVRERLPELRNSCKVLLSNINHFPTNLYPSRAAMSDISITQIASDVRRAINDSIPDEIKLTLGFRLQALISDPENASHTSFAPPNSECLAISNWIKMGWGGEWLDFTPALEEDWEGKKGSGKVIWVDVNAVGDIGAGPLMIMPRKDENGIWIWFTVASWIWRAGLLKEVPYIS